MKEKMKLLEKNFLMVFQVFSMEKTMKKTGQIFGSFFHGKNQQFLYNKFFSQRLIWKNHFFAVFLKFFKKLEYHDAS